jgi:sterol desaturase/sphingolipid hydroxylase (fatty acid hydroxylase superfamily)
MIAAAAQLVVLMVVFTILESRWPSARGHKWWRRSLLVDICGWMIHPLSLSAGITLAAAFTNGALAHFPGMGTWLRFLEMRGSVAALPAAVQIAMAVILADFLAYWIHRAYHRFPLLWAFHVVHHSSEELDWLSTSRLHPASQVLNTAVVAVVLLAMGIPVAAVVVANVVIGAAALLVHANVDWAFGSFRRLLVSPVFHHWHHARQDDGDADSAVGNFGAIFSLWDWLFGTWSLPVGRRPARFGVGDNVPLTPVGLLFHPLRIIPRLFRAVASPDRAEEQAARRPSVHGTETR